MLPVILEIDNISKTFFKPVLDKKGKKAREGNKVIDSLSMQLHKGLVSAIIGGNGAGKSTLFNLICRYIDCDTGAIYLQTDRKIDLTRCDAFKTARAGIGRLFQGTHVFGELTVMENMLIADESRVGENFLSPLFFYKQIRRLEKARTDEAIAIFDKLLGPGNDLMRHWQKKAAQLSYGQQRLLGMSRLLMNNSYSLILLDEPCAGVNIEIIHSLKEMILHMKQTGKSVLLIEHNIAFVKDIADECFFMDEGKIKYKGDTAHLITIPELKREYFGMLD